MRSARLSRSRARPCRKSATPFAAIVRRDWPPNSHKPSLETAGVAVKCDAAKVTLSPLQEGVLSMAVREAVTNVVRHAQARNCSLRLQQQNGSCRLEIEDDGRGGSQNEGNGLRGMRERVEMLGGSFTRDSQAGTRLAITVPLKVIAPKSWAPKSGERDH